MLIKEQIQAKFDEDGVSPVIGVILMVAVTVALVALVTVIVFDIGGDVSESPDATVNINVDQGNQSATATILRNENVDGFTLEATGSASVSGNAFGSNPSVGDSAEVYSGSADSGTIQVIATMSDGSEQVLTTTDYDW